jgi:hypothetical protein
VYDPNDEAQRFEELFAQGRITAEHYAAILKHRDCLALLGKDPSRLTTCSASNNFSTVDLGLLRAKIAYLGLDNLRLAPGNFAQTLAEGGLETGPLCAVLIDCDLYQSYLQVLEYAWPRLVPGGAIYFDEYYSLKFPGARIACDAFFADKPDKPQAHTRLPGDFERWFVRKG